MCTLYCQWPVKVLESVSCVLSWYWRMYNGDVYNIHCVMYTVHSILSVVCKSVEQSLVCWHGTIDCAMIELTV